jgi:peptidyl-dipeptidase Dcp
MEPLFNKTVKYDAIPFGKLSPKKFLTTFRKIIKESISELKQLEENEEEPSFFNTILELETIFQRAYSYYNFYTCYISVSDTASWCGEMNPKMNKTLARFDKALISKKLFEKIHFVYKNYDKNILTDADIALINHYYNYFQKQGIHLTPAKQKEFFLNEQRLLKKSLKYLQNLVSTHQSTLKLKTKDQLKGVSEHFISSAKKTAQKDSYSGFLLKVTDNAFYEILHNGKNRNIREKVYNLHYNSAQNKYLSYNEKIAREILRIRKKQANLLGFSNYSNLILDENSIKNYKNLSKMINSVLRAVKPQIRQLYKDIAKVAETQDGVTDFSAWDVDYYLDRYLQSKFSVNEKKLMAYFPKDHVEKEMFKIIYKIFGIKLTKVRLPVYHKDVQVFKATKGKKYLGLLYLDFMTRSSKESGAYCMHLVEPGFNRRPSLVVSSNVNPSSEKGVQPLLTLDNVIDIFHEMGHALHTLCTEVEYSCISGYNVAQDFSEVPSIFFETLAMQPKIIQQLSSHYKTKKKLSSKAVDNFLQVKKIQALKNVFFNVIYSKLDLATHRAPLNQLKNFSNFEQKVLNSTTVLKSVPGESILTNFDHIFHSEYAGSYYSYIWSDIISKDVMNQFLKSGSVFNKKVANKFYNEILTKGASLDEAILFKKFKGSDVSPYPFLKSLKASKHKK